MPQKGPQDNVSWARASELGINIHTTPDGGVELLRDNLAPNQYGLEIDDYGDADGYPIEVPEAPMGRHVYATDVDAPKRDLRRQTLSPQALGDTYWDFANPFVETGARPVRSTHKAHADLPQPPPPIVESVDGGIKGFPAGTRTVYLTRVAPIGNLHTLPSAGVEFTLAEGEGVNIFIPAPGDQTHARTKVGVWVTEVDGDKSTARLQRIVPHDIGEVLLDSFRLGRYLPGWDETQLWSPGVTRLRDFDKHRSRGYLYPGNYKVVTWYYSAFGMTAASGVSKTREVNSKQKNRALRLRRPRRIRGAIGWGMAVQYNGVWYVRKNRGKLGTRAAMFGWQRHYIDVNGPFTSNQLGDREPRTDLVAEDPPFENTAGIEAITEAPETPEVVTLSGVRPTAGKRWYAYSETITDPGGGEAFSVVSEAVSHTTAFGEIARVKFPDPVNLLQNAEGRIRDKDGRPAGWTFTGTNGRYGLEDNSTHLITTDGVGYASSTIEPALPLAEVNSEADYAIRASLAANITNGVGEIVLEELDEAEALLGTITVISLSATESTSETLRVGPNTARPFTAGTVYLRAKVRMAGTTRNMTLWFYDLALHPYIMAPRKVVKGAERTAASFEAAPSVPFPRGVVSAVGPAPATAAELGDIEAPEPFDVIDWTQGGEDEGVEWPAGWSSFDSGAGFNEVLAGPTDYGWRVGDYTKGTREWVSLERDFEADITASDGFIAIRTTYDVWWLANTWSQYLYPLRIRDTGGTSRVEVEIRGNYIFLWTFDASGTWTKTNVWAEITTGDSIDYEIRIENAGTSDATVKFFFGKNGAPRSLWTTTSVDWTGIYPGYMAPGQVWETDPASKWDFLYKRIAVTPYGDTMAGSLVPTDATLEPDRPSFVDEFLETQYRSYTEDGELINQMYLFVPPDTPRFDVPYFAKWSVLPGETYRFGVYGRHEIPEGEIGSKPWFLTLHNVETGEIVDLGSPYGDGASDDLSAWADRQLDAFTVPSDSPGWVELRASHRNMGVGLYLWQEWAYSKDTVVNRGYGVATGPETFSVVLERVPPGGESQNPKRELNGARVDLGLVPSDEPDGTTTTAEYRGADTEAGLDSATPQTDPLLVPESEFYRITGTLTGDGRETPLVDSNGGPYLTVAPTTAILLRADGTELPGGVLVDGIDPPPRRARFEATTVGGHRHLTDTTDPVMWTNEVTLEVYTEDALNELNEKWFEDYQVEVPHFDNGAGLVLDIRFADEFTLVEDENIAPSYRNGHRWLWAKASGVISEVVGVEPLITEDE